MDQGLMQPQRLGHMAKLTFAWHMIDVLAQGELLVQSADFESEEILQYLLQHHKALASVCWFTFLAPSTLRHVSLKDCNHFNTGEVVQILDKCSEPTILSLENCSSVNISQILKIAPCALTCLVTLNLSNCKLTDGDVQTVLRTSRNLQHLSLAETEVGDQSFLLHSRLQQEVEVGQTMEQAEEFRPQLVTVDLSGCSSFSNQGLHHLCSLSGASLRSINLQQTGVDIMGLLFLVGHSRHSACQLLENAGCLSRIATVLHLQIDDTDDDSSHSDGIEKVAHLAEKASDLQLSTASCLAGDSCVKHLDDYLSGDGATAVFSSSSGDNDRGLKEWRLYSERTSDTSCCCAHGDKAESSLGVTSHSDSSRLVCSTDHFNPASSQSENMTYDKLKPFGSTCVKKNANSSSWPTDSSSSDRDFRSGSFLQSGSETGQDLSPICSERASNDNYNLGLQTSKGVDQDLSLADRRGQPVDSSPACGNSQATRLGDGSRSAIADDDESSRLCGDSSDSSNVRWSEIGSYLSLELEQGTLEEVGSGNAGLLSPFLVPKPPPPSSQSSLSLSSSSGSTSASSSLASPPSLLPSSPPSSSVSTLSLSSSTSPLPQPPPSLTSLSSSAPPSTPLLTSPPCSLPQPPSLSSPPLFLQPPPPPPPSLSSPPPPSSSSPSSSLPPQPPPSSLSSPLSQPTPSSPSSPAQPQSPLQPPPPPPPSPPQPPPPPLQPQPSPPSSPVLPPPPPTSPAHPFPQLPRLFCSRLTAVAFSSNVQLCHLIDHSLPLVCFEEFLKESPCLRELRVWFEPKVCDERVRPLICSSPLFIAFICEAVKAVGDLLPGVQHLTINQDDIDVSHFTDSLVEQLLEKCTELVSLDLSGCYRLSDAAFTPLQCQKSLKRLHISTTSITFSSPCFQHFTPFTQLSSLDLSWCEEMDGDDLDQALSACGCVTSLRLRHCPVTNGTLAVMAVHCRSLVSLDIAGARDLEDCWLVHLVKALPGLMLLDIANNSGLKDESVSAVLLHCPLLEMLDLSCLHLVTEQPFLPIITGISWQDWLAEYTKHKQLSTIKKHHASPPPGNNSGTALQDEKMWVPRRSTSYGSCLRKVNLSYCGAVEDRALRVVVTVGRGGLEVYGYHQETILPHLILLSNVTEKLWVQLEDQRRMF